MRTTFDTERCEPLIEYDLPDDWYRCKACKQDVDPEDVKDRFLTDSELCSSGCAAEYIATLEHGLENEQRVNALRKTALQKVLTATEGRKVAILPLVWFAVQKYVAEVNQFAVNGLYLVKEDAIAKTNAQPQPVVATKPIEVA